VKYTIEFNARGGRRVEWIEYPAEGSKFINQFGDVVTFDEISFAGMLACTSPDGVQSLYFPEQLKPASGGDRVD
jgi:hypothetical protein